MFGPTQTAATRRALFAIASGAALPACTPAQVVDAIFPNPVPYPDPAGFAAAEAEARRLSDGLLAHIDAWMAGRAPARLPAALIPRGVDENLREVRLVRPEAVTPEDVWMVRPAEEKLDFERLRGLYPDPHCTYVVPTLFYLPFGCTATLEGEFPHARFFSVQVAPPFDPRFYYYNGAFGAPEVPLVDVDIDPLPGHTNPFRPGADRAAPRRGYRIELTTAIGDGAQLDPAFRPPHWRAPGNRRLGSGIQYQGPLADPAQRGHKRGRYDTGVIWVRYYAPDRGRGPLAGVALPRLSYSLPDGRPFLIVGDRAHREASLNRTFAARRTAPEEPNPRTEGPSFGWFRDLDIFHGGVAGIWLETGKTAPADKAQGRALVRGFVAKGEELGGSGWYANSASRSAHISYLSRGMRLGRGKVIVLTGRMPRHPRTLDGARRVEGGQVRYFSITSYPTPDIFRLQEIGTPMSSVMDEEIVTDPAGRYVICYSRPEDRPANARAEAGVTWVDWGPQSGGGWTIRWLTVHPDCKDTAITPDDALIPYRAASWLSEGYDPRPVGTNDHRGLMGEYLPRVHSMPRAAFEALGARVARVPAWV